MNTEQPPALPPPAAVMPLREWERQRMRWRVIRRIGWWLFILAVLCFLGAGVAWIRLFGEMSGDIAQAAGQISAALSTAKLWSRVGMVLAVVSLLPLILASQRLTRLAAVNVAKA